MTKDLKLVNMTTQDFASAKDLELFENRWEKMGKEYYPLLRKGGMIKHSVLKVWNKLSEHRYIHIFEYEAYFYNEMKRGNITKEFYKTLKNIIENR